MNLSGRGAFVLVCLLIGLLAGVLTHTAHSQEVFIGGPLLGFAVNVEGKSISPIWGVVGASVLGTPLDFGIGISNAVLSPAQNDALAVRNHDGRIIVLNLSVDPPAFVELPGPYTEATQMAISPKGIAAALVDSASVRTYRGLPDFPELVYQFDISHLASTPKAVAVSDDGMVVLANMVDSTGGEMAWVSTSSGALWPVSTTGVAAMAFLPGRYDALIADPANQEIALLLGLDSAANRVPLAQLDTAAYSPPIGVAASKDGRLFVFSSESPELMLIDAETHRAMPFDCSCSPTALHPLRGDGAFLLSRTPADLLYVLDVSSDPRVVVVPTTVGPATVEPESSEQSSER
jgi:hypothetical protein